MSLATWEKEFYPTHASDVKIKDAIKHSLLKWKGLKPKNLEKHSVYVDLELTLRSILENEEEEGFFIGSENCALCNFYMDIDSDSSCKGCPLALARNGIPCDTYSEDLDVLESSPWRIFIDTGSPIEMLYWLNKAAKNRLDH